MSYNGLVGTFFIEDDLNRVMCLKLLQNQILLKLKEQKDFEELWWQQNGAPKHYSLAVCDWVNWIFPWS